MSDHPQKITLAEMRAISDGTGPEPAVAEMSRSVHARAAFSFCYRPSRAAQDAEEEAGGGPPA
jgi:hypothetical protein